ncbi:PTS sugar transporter subunit IIA [Arenicella xantha]|uniref:Phosphotransferase IIA-like nitrogen-regulatory protein PtsN n=1 Tax=Arenicella xantha TaxID=644221 RepID=A0A395JHN6_9GAMM|nr:PTS sugar transporter subunit IIA [Arenicella xantha]RBP49650.1 phosphotransferase IIA-like nitrogen-regulatory protein PtsN [Arenicella xantha]
MTTSNFLFENLNAELISVHADVSSRKRLLEEMARLLAIPLIQKALEDELDDVKEKDIYHQLWEREKLGNTGIGNGVALPHSRSQQAHKAIIAIITLEQPIDYDSLDRQPVDVAFGLLVPMEATQDHLNLLADIARMMSNDANKSAIAKATSAEKIIQLIEKWSK